MLIDVLTINKSDGTQRIHFKCISSTSLLIIPPCSSSTVPLKCQKSVSTCKSKTARTKLVEYSHALMKFEPIPMQLTIFIESTEKAIDFQFLINLPSHLKFVSNLVEYLSKGMFIMAQKVLISTFSV